MPGSSLAWSRRRVATALAAACVTALLLIAGLGYALWGIVTDGRSPVAVRSDAVEAGITGGSSVRDRIAATPLTARPPVGGPPVSRGLDGAALAVPSPTRLGPAGVPTGYPRTPAGAVGQLAAIDVTVLTAMTAETVSRVHARWALAGAPASTDWVMSVNVEDFLAATATSSAAGRPAVVTVTPLAGQVRGVDGPDWTLACVLLRVEATLVTTAAVTDGHCERMAWSDGRWQIAAGAQPPRVPSVVPGTRAAAQAGWRDWATTDAGGSDGSD